MTATPQHRPDRLMVVGNSPIKDIKELDGKPVGVHAKGSISYIMLQAIAKAKDIKPVILEVPAPAIRRERSRGDIAAAMMERPFPEQLLVAGGRSVFSLPDASVVPYMAATVSLTTARYAQEHPDVVAKLVAVEMRTARWMMDNPAKARDMISARLNYKPEITQAINPSCYKFGRNALFLTSLVALVGPNNEGRVGTTQAEPDYDKYFVTTYAEAAAKAVGLAADPDFEALQKISLN